MKKNCSSGCSSCHNSHARVSDCSLCNYAGNGPCGQGSCGTSSGGCHHCHHCNNCSAPCHGCGSRHSGCDSGYGVLRSVAGPYRRPCGRHHYPCFPYYTGPCGPCAHNCGGCDGCSSSCKPCCEPGCNSCCDQSCDPCCEPACDPCCDPCCTAPVRAGASFFAAAPVELAAGDCVSLSCNAETGGEFTATPEGIRLHRGGSYMVVYTVHVPVNGAINSRFALALNGDRVAASGLDVASGSDCTTNGYTMHAVVHACAGDLLKLVCLNGASVAASPACNVFTLTVTPVG